MELKITQIGNSLGVILPKEMLKEMNLTKGDIMSIDRREGSEWRIAPFDEMYNFQLNVARKIMKKRRNLLKALAKA